MPFGLPARAKSRQQLAVYASESTVAHDHHAVTGPRGMRDRFDQCSEIVVEFGAGSERRQRLGNVPTEVRGVAKDAIGRRKARGQHRPHGSELHGVRARLEHRENATGSNAPTHAIEGRGYGSGVVREVVVYRDAANRSAQLESPPD